MARVALLAAAAFAAVSALVAAGGFASVDQWAVEHAMPWLTPAAHPQDVVSILTPFGSGTPRAEVALDLWTYPASVPVSALLLALCCAVLWRRGRRAAAVGWAAAWVVGDAVEALGKGLLDRPALHMTWHGVQAHLVGFDDSFPSGHTLRGMLLALLVGLVWQRARLAAAVWAAVTLALLVVTSAHTPSDVLGGALLAAALAASASRLDERGRAGGGRPGTVRPPHPREVTGGIPG